MAVRAPILAQQLEGACWQGHIAVFAFAMPDVEQPTVAIHILNLQMSAFSQTQATRVDGAEAHSIRLAAEAVQDAAHFVGAEHHWQLFFMGWTNPIQRDVGAVEGLHVKEPQAVQGKGVGAARNVLVVLEVEEILTEFFGRDAVRGLVPVFGQLPDGAQIGVLDRPRSCRSSIMRWRNGVMGMPPVEKFDGKYSRDRGKRRNDPVGSWGGRSSARSA
jgi:hypothetical protein